MLWRAAGAGPVFANNAIVIDLALPSGSHPLVLALAGGSVSLPNEIPTSGLLTFTASVLCAFVMVRIAAASAGMPSSPSAGLSSTGDVTLLVRDGMLQVDALDRAVLTREDIFAALRARGIHQLGEVARFYLEPNGSFALVKRPDPEPGLSVWRDSTSAPERSDHDHALQACVGCGQIVRAGDDEPCAGCHETRREPVVR